MIENVTIRKASIGSQPLLFEVGYVDIQKKHDNSYFRTTRYGTEAQMRELLRSYGVPDADIDQLFENA